MGLLPFLCLFAALLLAGPAVALPAVDAIDRVFVISLARRSAERRPKLLAALAREGFVEGEGRASVEFVDAFDGETELLPRPSSQLAAMGMCVSEPTRQHGTDGVGVFMVLSWRDLGCPESSRARSLLARR